MTTKTTTQYAIVGTECIYWIAAYPEFEYMMYELFMDKVL